MSVFSAREQLFLEYVNRARLDPLNETARLLAEPGVTGDTRTKLDLGEDGLNRGLPAGTISGLPLQPLAPNGLLRDAAEGHSAWMLEANVFSHDGENGSTVPQRIAAAGYVVVAPGGTGENLSWRGTTGTMNMDTAVLGHHAGLFASDGHRRNTLTDWFRETGVAQLNGDFTHSNGITYDSSMLAQKFAASGAGVFLTGVAYADTDGDAFYSIGEGQAGVTIAAAGATTQTAQAGGYALGLTAAANVSVTMTWGAQQVGAVVDLSDGNAKLDLVAGTGGVLRLLSSSDLGLGAGAAEGALLGAADLRIAGNGDANLLIGNRGDNVLSGGAGDDTLAGGAGNDTLDGGTGTNTARFSGNRADYLLTQDGAATLVADQRGPGTALAPHDGTDRVTNIRFLEFADQTHDLAPPPPPPPAGTFRLGGSVALGTMAPAGITARFTDGSGAQQQAALDAQGAFGFDIPAGSSGTLDLLRDYTAGSDKALGIGDVLAAFRMVAGVTTSPGPQAVVAADFNTDGSADIFDVLALFRHVAGVPGASSPRYVFVEDGQMPDGTAMTGLPGAGGTDIAAMSADVSLAFQVILSGDVLAHV